MESTHKNTAEQLTILAIVTGMALIGVGIFWSDYYVIDAHDGLAAEYGVAYDNVDRVSMHVDDDGAAFADATVTRVLDDHVFIAESPGSDRVLVVHEQPLQDRVFGVDPSLQVGDHFEGDGRFESLDEQRLLEHGVASNVLTGTNLPEVVFYADEVSVK